MQFIDYGDGRNGSVSAASGVVNSYATCLGTSGSPTVTTSLSVSAGDLIMLHQSRGSGVGNWELVKVLTPGTGEFTADRNLTNSYVSGAQAVLIPQYTSGVCSNTLSASSWNGSVGGILAVHVNGAATFSGALNVPGASGGLGTSGSGATGGGFRGGDADINNPANTGEGNIGASVTNQFTANGSGGGGAKDNGSGPPFHGGGGGGGHATSGSTGGTNGNGVGGVGGGTSGNADLTTMTFGGGGGGGTEQSGTVAGGASGGGIVAITAVTIAITGSVNLNGGNGTNDEGGAGAGGSCLIKGNRISLGTNLVTATGGSASVLGGAGGAGRIHVDYGITPTGTTNPTFTSAKDTKLNPFLGNFIPFL